MDSLPEKNAEIQFKNQEFGNIEGCPNENKRLRYKELAMDEVYRCKAALFRGNKM